MDAMDAMDEMDEMDGSWKLCYGVFMRIECVVAALLSCSLY